MTKTTKIDHLQRQLAVWVDENIGDVEYATLVVHRRIGDITINVIPDHDTSRLAFLLSQVQLQPSE